LFDAVRDDQVDLTRLLVGSEGTLAVITQAKLLTDPQPRHRGVCLLFFHRFEIAAQAAVEIVNMGVVACDLIDRRLLTLAAETNPDFQRIIPAEAESVLLVEVQAEDHVTLQGQLDALKYRISQRRKLTFLVRATTQKAERDLFWKLTRRIIPTLYRLRGNKRALTFIDDIAVDPVQLPKFLKVLHSTLNEFEVTASILAHAPQGAVDVRPFLDLSDPADLKTMQRLAETMLERVLEFGGTASGSCGDGLSRSWFLKRQFGDLYPAMQAIKNTFDPSNILNPGKKIPTGDQHVAHRVRLVKVPQPQISVTTPGSDSVLRVLQPQMPWGIDDVAQAARNCNGCGRCRTGLAEERMCPIFRLEPREESSPRAKANLMRGIVTAQLPAQTITADHFKEIADLCFNCHQCRLDCPASVDIPRLVMEAKANHYAVNGCRFSDWLLTRLDWLYDTAGRMPRLANSCIKSPLARGILDRFFGIARSRKLPRFDSKRFSRWVSQNRLDRPSKRQALKVCYFADAYVAWNDGELGQALVNVFKHNGIDVLVPARQGISAMSLISEGAIGPARKIAARNVEALAEYVRQGYQVITSEPSATLALKHEYLNILDDNDTRLVAENTIDACTLLLQLHGAGELKLDFAPQNVRVGYHLPCHQRVFSKFPPAVQLLQLVPGLQIDHLDKGCSGMAGTWGLKPRNLGDSLKIGFGLMNAVQESTIDIGSTECSACKIQMEHGTPKPTIHPVKVLAKAYGLMPELSDLYRRRSGELTTT
jgi:Fe-S oxidoreductase